VKFNLSLC